MFLNNCAIGQYIPRKAPDEIVDCLEEMGIDTVPLLNECESKYFNYLFLDRKGFFDFRDKKIALFVPGGRITKKRYFDLKKKYFRTYGYLDMNPWPQLFVLKKEIGEQFGYDAVIIIGRKKRLSEKEVIRSLRRK